jgi:N-ethylmaleimide reductase
MRQATNVSPQAVGYALTPGIWSDAQVQAWQPVVDAVHDRGGRFLLQLWHTGRISHPDLHGGDKPVAPSAIRPEGQAYTKDGMKDHVEPRALQTDEIPAIVEDYRRAAGAVVGVWGPGRVGIRLSPATTQAGGTALDSSVMETYGTYLDRLADFRLAYTHFIEGVTYTTRESDDEVDFAELRRRSPGAYIGNNELSVADARQVLANGEADLISFARAYIANPDLVQRIRTGAPLAEAPQEYWYGGDETGYSDWPAMQRRAA